MWCESKRKIYVGECKGLFKLNLKEILEVAGVNSPLGAQIEANTCLKQLSSTGL